MMHVQKMNVQTQSMKGHSPVNFVAVMIWVPLIGQTKMYLEQKMEVGLCLHFHLSLSEKAVQVEKAGNRGHLSCQNLQKMQLVQNTDTGPCSSGM